MPDPSFEPRTHALVVGVGDYTDQALRLGSPHLSAQAVATWLQTRLQNPAAPLGSLDLLLSPTYAALDAAIKAWFKRATDNPDNVALFYFCGHGLMRTGSLLLAADFDKDDLNPYACALDFDKLVLGMGRCRAGVQCFFVDACRSMPFEIRDEADLTAGVPIAPRLSDPPRADSLVLYSSAPQQQAFGAPDEPSRFTRVLIDCLEGLGSRKRAGRWEVSTATLGEAVRRILERRSHGLQHAVPQGSPQGALLHVVSTRPRVPLRIVVDPPRAAAAATLRLLRSGSDDVVAERPPQPGPWDIEVTAASYDVVAEVGSGPPTRHDEIFVLPPEVEEPVTVVT